MGIGCQLSDDWTYYTDEQLAELSGVVAESSEEMQKAMEDGKSTYDMFASAMEGLVTINVVYEDLGALYGKLLDEAGYLEIAVPKLEDALASMRDHVQLDGGYHRRSGGAVLSGVSRGETNKQEAADNACGLLFIWFITAPGRRWCAGSADGK